eukprot:4241274-Amphidinium_carterae.2
MKFPQQSTTLAWMRFLRSCNLDGFLTLAFASSRAVDAHRMLPLQISVHVARTDSAAWGRG